jgi:hypothetical protein
MIKKKELMMIQIQLLAFIESGDVDIVDGNNNLFIKRYIPDMKDQQGAVNIQFLVRQYPGSVQTVASSTLVYSTTTKVDMRARGRQVAIKIISTEVDTKWRYGTLRIDGQQKKKFDRKYYQKNRKIIKLKNI